MKKRVLGAFIILFLLILSLIIGSYAFNLLMCLCALLSFIELFNIRYDNKKDIVVMKLFGIFSLLLILFNGIFYNVNNYSIYIIPILLITLPILIYNDNKKYNINDAIYILGICYFLSISYGTLIKVSNLDILKCVYIFIIAFITDTYAYIGGRLIGKHRLCEISPNKTVEGSIIGVVMGTIVGTVYYLNVVGSEFIFVLLMSLALSIMGEIGDLMFSSIKRYFNKKDYSNIIPGHGGILDRFDSVIFIALLFILFLGFI